MRQRGFSCVIRLSYATADAGRWNAPCRTWPAMRRRLILGVLAVPLLILLYRVLAIYTVRSGDCRPRPVAQETRDLPPNARPLVVMTWNIAGHAELTDGDHVRHVADAIRRIRPDVVALQEVHRGTWQSRFRDQLAELESLTGLRGTFAPSYVQWGGGYGNAILTRGQIVRAEVYPLCPAHRRAAVAPRSDDPHRWGHDQLLLHPP